jgi:hypothetical protein
MEMLDSDDPIKRHLLRKSEQHREQVEEDVKLISERTEKIIINALVIGGALAATYFLINSLSGSKSKNKKLKKVRLVKEEDTADQVVVEPAEPEKPGMLAEIGTALASQATMMLLAFAKEKLGEYLKSENQPKENISDDNNH